MCTRLKIISTTDIQELQSEVNGFLANLEKSGFSYDVTLNASASPACAFVLYKDISKREKGVRKYDYCYEKCTYYEMSAKSYTGKGVSDVPGEGTAYCVFKGERIDHFCKCCGNYYQRQEVIGQ